MKNNKIPAIGEKLSRAGEISADASGQIELSFSSEEPVDRYFGREILSHAEGACDLSRLQEIGTVLFSHDPEEPIARIDKVWIEGKRGKALISFDDDEKSQRICNKVKRGSLRGVSVGYQVQEWKMEEGQGGQPDTYTATKWMPYEISIVSIPADASVGVGRAMETGETGENTTNIEDLSEKYTNQSKNIVKSIDITEKREISSMEKEKIQEPKVIEAPQINTTKIVEEERARIREITAMCRDFNVDADKLINDGATIEQARAAILSELKTRKQPVSVKVEQEENDKFRAAAVDALAMRAGAPIANPAEGADILRGYSLKKLAVEAMARDPRENRTYQEINRMSDDDLFGELQRSFYNPTAAFPSILDQAIRKSFVEAYRAAPTTFEAWTTKGSLSDFKETKEHNYIIGGGSFEKVTEAGELKASKPSTEMLPTRKLDTYGTQFTMTREAFINDDIGLLSRIPGVYAVAAKRKINRQIYEILVNNGKIYDGKNLFDNAHANVVTTGAKPSLATINALMLKLQAQKDPFGEAINVLPRTLILPVGYGMEVDTILHAAAITTSDSNNTGYNPLANKGLTYVEDATLNDLAGTGACPWFLVADPSSAKSIQVDYLNGQEVPTIRRMEKAGQLGFAWDIFLDWGVSVIDYRGIAKNAGVKIEL